MSEHQPNRVILTFKEAAKLTRCTADELLKRLDSTGVPVYIRVPSHLDTFAHLSRRREAWRLEGSTARLVFTCFPFDLRRTLLTQARMDQRMPSRELVRIDESALTDIMILGGTGQSRFSEMILTSSGTADKVLPRHSFPQLSIASLFQRDSCFVTASQVKDGSKGELIETDIQFTQSDLWIERESLGKLSAAREVRQFGEISLEHWASTKLIELNEASYALFSNYDGCDSKKAKEIVIQWFEVKWNKVPHTIRGHVPSLIIPDRLLRESKSLQQKIPNPVFTLPKNQFTSTRLALMNEVAAVAHEEQKLHSRERILKLLSDRKLAGAIGSSAASIIKMSGEEQLIYG